MNHMKNFQLILCVLALAFVFYMGVMDARRYGLGTWSTDDAGAMGILAVFALGLVWNIVRLAKKPA
jgi:hypothetical protein